MKIDTTRAYYFTAEEMRIIYAFCQIVDSVAISEHMDYDNQHYSAENLFNEKYKEFINNGECNPTFSVSVDD